MALRPIDVIKILRGNGAEYMFDTMFLTAIPVLFESAAAYDRWRVALLTRLGLPNAKLFIAGSCLFGISLSPTKDWRKFCVTHGNYASDIDLSVICPNCFSDAWNSIIDSERSMKLRLPSDQRQDARANVYQGFVQDSHVQPNTAGAKNLLNLEQASGKQMETAGIRLRVRFYRRLEDYRAYQTQSLEKLKNT